MRQKMLAFSTPSQEEHLVANKASQTSPAKNPWGFFRGSTPYNREGFRAPKEMVDPGLLQHRQQPRPLKSFSLKPLFKSGYAQNWASVPGLSCPNRASQI